MIAIPNPVFSVRSIGTPVSVASRFEHLLRHETSLPHAVTEMLVRHLTVIESMEARLAAGEIPPEQFEELVGNCHRLINEVQRLHLASHLRHASSMTF